MIIYFSASIRGGRAEQPMYNQIVSILKKYGDVISKHVADDTISTYGETEFTKEEIYAKEMEKIKKSDLVIADVTTPSLGVGYIISQALGLNKKVICLYHGKNIDKLSAMISGDSRINIHDYIDVKNLTEKIKQIFTNL